MPTEPRFGFRGADQASKICVIVSGLNINWAILKFRLSFNVQ